MNQIGLDLLLPKYEKIPLSTFTATKTMYKITKSGYYIVVPDDIRQTASYLIEVYDSDPKNEPWPTSDKALACYACAIDGNAGKDNSNLMYLAEVKAFVQPGQYVRFYSDKAITFRTFMAVPEGSNANIPEIDGKTIIINEAKELQVSVATQSTPGVIIPDGDTTQVDSDGKLSAFTTPKTDGTTIIAAKDGKLSANIDKIVIVDGTTIKKDASGKLSAVIPATPLFPWNFILYIGWNSGGSYLLGTLDRGSAIRMRSTVFASPDCADTDAIEYNIWANSDASTIAHDMPRNTAANINYFFNTATSKFELYFSVPSGRHRYRNFWYQLLQGTFAKSGEQIAAPPSPMVPIQAVITYLAPENTAWV
jgi:hypothetical protein